MEFSLRDRILMRVTPTVSHVEVEVLVGGSCGEWVGDIVVVTAKAEIVIGCDSGKEQKKLRQRKMYQVWKKAGIEI